MKDILVDNNIAKNFSNPLDEEYKKFITWLYSDGSLVLINRLIREYTATSGSSYSSTNIAIIINKLQSTGRLNFISKENLQEFRIPPRVLRRLRSNHHNRSSYQDLRRISYKITLQL